jgi:hypothetical protein
MPLPDASSRIGVPSNCIHGLWALILKQESAFSGAGSSQQGAHSPRHKSSSSQGQSPLNSIVFQLRTLLRGALLRNLRIREATVPQPRDSF